MKPCLRTNGTTRAWFYSREDAEAFAASPANSNYHGDIAHLCVKCNLYHLSKQSWLEPRFTTADYQMLKAAGIETARALCCELCRSVQQEGEEFFILTSGALRCSKCADA
jgi:hypothetical protein